MKTSAKVHLEKGAEGFGIPKIELVTEANVPGIDEAKFKAEADKAKRAHARRLAVQIAIETEYHPGKGRSAQPQCDFEGAHGLQFSGSGRTAEDGQARSARGFLEVECECNPTPVAGVLSKAD